MYFTHLNLSSLPSHFDGRAITIGSFDGIHIGHQKILSELNQYAKAHNLQRTLVTFSPLPPEYFKKGISHRLMSLRDKAEFLKKSDLVDEIILIPFSKAMATITADSFLDDILIDHLQMKALFVGKDFKFGHKAQGNIEFLAEALKDRYHFSAIDDLTRNDIRVSSTKIREYLADSNLPAAKEFLGRDYSLIGKVVPGNQLARTWGMPTINIHLQHDFPLIGIYNATAENLCTGKKYTGAASIGFRPTIGGSSVVLEVHLHDTNEDLYAQFFKVSFINKMRDEIKFDTLEDLRKQIEHDITDSYSFFKDYSE